MRAFGSRLRAWRRVAGERGTALVELAIIMPLFLVLLLGMVDFGQAFNDWLDETHLAHDGVRLAAVNYNSPTCTGSNKSTCLAQYIFNNLDIGELRNGRASDSYAPGQSASRVCISFPAVSGHANPLVGDPVQVRITVDYQWLKYLTRQLNLPGGKTTLTANATMRLEGTPTNYSAGCYP
jgi:hypothetical protein